nr:hypothetical protein [Tanacetum cinerariifolium]
VDRQKESNEMYYPRFTKVIIDYFMTRKPSIPKQNRVNWHYVRDDVLFTTIKVESEDEETREQDEESFDPIPRTPKDNEVDDNNEEDQGLRIDEEERMQEEEDAEELYCD